MHPVLKEVGLIILAMLVMGLYYVFCLWYDGKLGMTPWW